jgi:putative endonuclease
MLSKSYYLYIMTNESDTLYTGVTNDLTKRVYQHKNKLLPGFTAKYNITRLVYFEETNDRSSSAGAREADQRMAKKKEDCFDRIGQSKMAGLER